MRLHSCSNVSAQEVCRTVSAIAEALASKCRMGEVMRGVCAQIRMITLVLGGEGYLNFMGNEFGHPGEASHTDVMVYSCKGTNPMRDRVSPVPFTRRSSDALLRRVDRLPQR